MLIGAAIGTDKGRGIGSGRGSGSGSGAGTLGFIPMLGTVAGVSGTGTESSDKGRTG